MEKIQYISQGGTLLEQEININNALKAGVRWVQLRCKDHAYEDVLQLAIKVKKWCDTYGAVLIINDSVAIAVAIDASGVHLGLADGSVSEARKLLGGSKIIGGTANTLNDVLQRVEEGCDYIGLGPLRHTETKKKLSPILGFEGVKDIINRANKQTLPCVPIYVIGGVGAHDIDELDGMGVYGIAVSSILTSTPESFYYLNQKFKKEC